MKGSYDFLRKKTGLVYLVKLGDSDLFKIGKTNNMVKRLSALNVGNPEKLSVFHVIRSHDAYRLESHYHSKFKSNKVKGEWFKLSPDEVADFCGWFWFDFYCHTPYVEISNGKRGMLRIGSGENIIGSFKLKCPLKFFRMIGQVGYTEYEKLGVRTMDSWEIAMKFNSSEQWFMSIVARDMCTDTFVVVIRGKALTPAEKRRLTKAYRTLHAKNIITRVKREYYMVSPLLFTPAPEDRDRIFNTWVQLNGIKVK